MAKEYSRLPGRGRYKKNAFFTASRGVYSMWLGPDHLLLVERIGYTETYKRFYYRDIQAFIIRRTAGMAIFSSIMGGIAALLIIPGFFVSSTPRIVLFIIGGFFLFGFLVNLIFGATCITHIQTAVQTEQLPPWNRVPSTQKALKKVRARMLEAQGELLPSDLKTQWISGLRGEPQNPAPPA